MTFPHIIISDSPEDTERVGESLASYISENENGNVFIAMYGDLGVGKTAFVRGLASVISPESAVRSPTFALVNEYRNKKNGKKLYHFDVYRIESEDDLYSIGFYDYLEDRNAVCAVEWSENIPYALPEEHYTVTIEKTDISDPDKRRITVNRISSEE